MTSSSSLQGISHYLGVQRNVLGINFPPQDHKSPGHLLRLGEIVDEPEDSEDDSFRLHEISEAHSHRLRQRDAMIKDGSTFMRMCNGSNFLRSLKSFTHSTAGGRRLDTSVGFNSAFQKAGAGKAIYIDGGDETAAALASSGILEQVELGLRLGLVYPGFMIPTHAGAKAAEQDLREVPEHFRHVRNVQIQEAADLRVFIKMLLKTDAAQNKALKVVEGLGDRLKRGKSLELNHRHVLRDRLKESYRVLDQSLHDWQKRDHQKIPSLRRLKLLTKNSDSEFGRELYRVIKELTDQELADPEVLDLCVERITGLLKAKEKHADALIKAIEAPGVAFGTGLMFHALAVFEASAVFEAMKVTAVENALSGVATGLIGLGQFIMGVYGIVNGVKGLTVDHRLSQLQKHIRTRGLSRELGADYQKDLLKILKNLRWLNGFENTLAGPMITAGQACMLANSVAALATLINPAAGVSIGAATMPTGLALTLGGTALKVGSSLLGDRWYHKEADAFHVDGVYHQIRESLRSKPYNEGDFRRSAMKHFKAARQQLLHRKALLSQSEEALSSKDFWGALDEWLLAGSEQLKLRDPQRAYQFRKDLESRPRALDAYRRSKNTVINGLGQERRIAKMIEVMNELGVKQDFLSNLMNQGYIESSGFQKNFHWDSLKAGQFAKMVAQKLNDRGKGEFAKIALGLSHDFQTSGFPQSGLSKAEKRMRELYLLNRLYRKSMKGELVNGRGMMDGQRWDDFVKLPPDLKYQAMRRDLIKTGLWNLVSENPFDAFIDKTPESKERQVTIPLFGLIPWVDKRTKYTWKKTAYLLDESMFIKAVVKDERIRGYFEKACRDALYQSYMRLIEGGVNYCDNVVLNLLSQDRMAQMITA